jgi:hypothetical protein
MAMHLKIQKLNFEVRFILGIVTILLIALKCFGMGKT